MRRHSILLKRDESHKKNNHDIQKTPNVLKQIFIVIESTKFNKTSFTLKKNASNKTLFFKKNSL